FPCPACCAAGSAGGATPELVSLSGSCVSADAVDEVAGVCRDVRCRRTARAGRRSVADALLWGGLDTRQTPFSGDGRELLASGCSQQHLMGDAARRGGCSSGVTHSL